MGKCEITTGWFYGHELTEQEKKEGWLSYGTLAKCFDCVLCNEIMSLYYEEAEIANGTDYDEEREEFYEFYQYYIISESGYRILQECTDETVWYIEPLNIYVCGITHFGTSWDYVSTDVKVIK